MTTTQPVAKLTQMSTSFLPQDPSPILSPNSHPGPNPSITILELGLFFCFHASQLGLCSFS
jgi:hypothetical protein